MKTPKKLIGFAVAATMILTAIPMSKADSSVKAAGFSAVALYDFEAGTGMQSSGINCSAPSVVSDPERGNVLKFADGANSKVINHDVDASLERHSYRIEEGSPSSLKFANPFKGRSLSGVTIAMWVKVPTEKAAGITSDGEIDETVSVASGLVGFVDSQERDVVHPDCGYGGHSDQVYSGRTMFGISTQPCVYFQQIHNNNYASYDSDATMADAVGVWKYLAASITNEGVVFYIDGEQVKGSTYWMGKRFKASDDYELPENDGMPYLLDFLADDMTYRYKEKDHQKGEYTFIDKNSKKQVTYGKIESNVSGYVGFTGFCGTQEGVCIDDLAFFTTAYGDGDMKALYEAAKVPGGITVSGGGGVSASGGGSAGNTGAAHSAVSAEAAAALASSTKLISAPEGVTIGAPIPILKDDPALGGTFDELKAALDAGLGAILAENPDWKDLKFSDNIYIQDIPLTGRELADGEKAVVEMDIPAGFDVNMLWVLRINDDGTLTKCNIVSMENGKLQFETDKLCKFAIVQMTTGSAKITQAGAVSTSVFVLFGAAAVAGGACLLKRKKEKTF